LSYKYGRLEENGRRPGIPSQRDVFSYCGDLSGDGYGALLAILRQESVFGFGCDVDAMSREVQIRPVQCLQFTATQSRRES
jgi:hypothetical protein